MKKRKWDSVRKGSKVTLGVDTTFPGFDGSRLLKAGDYFVCGFYGNACGLAPFRQIRLIGEPRQVEFYIPARSLVSFSNITE